MEIAESLKVIEPSLDYEDAFLRLLADYEHNDPENGGSYLFAATNFELYVRGLYDEEAGFNLPEGIVPCSHRWLVDEDGNILAVVRVRHTLENPFLSEVGGHIGYDVPPSQRGHRYAMTVLKAGLETAKEIGLKQVLVCCDANNIPSRKTIENCGGVLEKEFYSEYWPIPVRRYWFEL